MMGSGFAVAAMAGALLATQTAQAPAPLPPLPDFSRIKLTLWDWTAPMAPSQWSEPKLGGYEWRADHAVVRDGELVLSVSERASGQVQTRAASSAAASALWEVDVTLPEMRDGLIAAPLWTFNAKTFDEIDFEVVGRTGLQLTLWSAVDGRHTAVWSDTVIRGDLSGKRYRLAIAYEAGRRVRFFVDGALVADVTPDDAPLGFPSTVQKPYFDLWVANGLDPRWAGRWRPLAAGERLTMRLHGYRASPIPPSLNQPPVIQTIIAAKAIQMTRLKAIRPPKTIGRRRDTPSQAIGSRLPLVSISFPPAIFRVVFGR